MADGMKKKIGSGFIQFKFRQWNLWSSAHPYISGLICLISTVATLDPGGKEVWVEISSG